MDYSLKLLFTIASLLLFVSGNLLEVHATTSYKPNYKPSKLFVFGDSYVDAGNSPKPNSSSWKPPYGETFPGEPAGRWSNGRVWSDYVAKFLGLKSPVPYELRSLGKQHKKYGMNFAYGGTGVFNTLSPLPNMTVQIDHFEQLINDKVYNSKDLESSVALVAISGNDYFAFLTQHGFNDTQEWLAFITKLVNQMVVDAERIRGLGVKTIAVDSLAPLGCIPYVSSFNSSGGCFDPANTLAIYHNFLLQQAIAKLNNQTTNNNPYIYVDLYTTFLTILENHGKHPGSNEFVNPLKECCTGTNKTYNCGSVDDDGVKQYTVCAEPDSSFFWDRFHPTQYGWRHIYLPLRNTLTQL